MNEWLILEMVNGCHRKKGLYKGSYKSCKTGLWLKFKFDNSVWMRKFSDWVRVGEIGLAMKLGEKGSNEIHVLVPV